MVKILCMLLLFASLNAETISVHVDLPDQGIFENTPFPITLTISHPKDAKIDPQQFSIKDKKIDAKEIQSSDDSTTYQFQYPGLEKGVQLLPAITFVVDGKKYATTPIGFEVKSTTATANGKPQPFLQVLPIITATSPIYPGQQFYVGYRYTYNTSIDLNEETLPLLEIKGFKKVGDKQIDQNEKDGLSIVQITQKLEAIEPGEFKVDASLVSGYPYVINRAGQKQYANAPLVAKVAPLTLTISAIPKTNKPASYSGAIGTFTFDAALTSASDVHVGDPIELTLTVKGQGEWDTVQVPDICCQPGFSGFFTLSDLPPLMTQKDNTKTFKVTLYAQNGDAKTIPPIEFSSLDPKTGAYGEQKSKAIPIHVVQGPLEPIPTPPITLPEDFKQPPMPAIYTPPFIIPLLGIATAIFAYIIFYAFYHTYQAASSASYKPKESYLLYRQALHEKSDSELFTRLEQALRHLLFEKGVSSLDQPLDEMKPTDSTQKIVDLLQKVEKYQYAKDAELNRTEVLGEVAKWFQD